MSIISTTAAIRGLIPNLNTKDIYMAYLPLAHVFELAAEVNSFVHFPVISDLLRNYQLK